MWGKLSLVEVFVDTRMTRPETRINMTAIFKELAPVLHNWEGPEREEGEEVM